MAAEANIIVRLSDGKKAGNTLKELRQQANGLTKEINNLPVGSEKFIQKSKELQTVNGRLKATREEIKGVGKANNSVISSFAQYLPFGGQLQNLSGGFRTLTGATNGWGMALKAIPIILLVSLVIELYQAIKKTVAGTEFFQQALAALGAVFSTLQSQIGRFLTGQISFSELLSETGDEIEENVKATWELIRARRELEKSTVDNELAESRLQKEIAKQRATADSDAVSLSRRRAAQRAITELEKEQSAIRVDQALDEAEEKALALRAQTKGTEEYRKAQNELTAAIARVNVAQAEQTAVVADATRELEMIRLDQFEQELDLLLDITDRQKTINERQIKDEETSLAVKKQLAEENARIIEDAYQRQIQAFEELNGVRIDEQKILEMTPTQLLMYADSLGFSERAVNRLREVVIEKIAADQDNLETIREVTKAEQERAAEAEKNLQDLRIQAIKDGHQREIEQLELNTERKIEALVGSEEQIREQELLLKEIKEQQLFEIEEKYRLQREQASDKETKQLEKDQQLLRDTYIQVQEAKRAAIEESTNAAITLFDEESKAGKAASLIQKSAAITDVRTSVEKQLTAAAEGGAKISAVAPPFTIPLGKAYTVAASIAAVASGASRIKNIQKAEKGFIARGKRHAQGGIMGIVSSTGEPVEFEDGEIILNRRVGLNPAGRKMASDLNVAFGGRSFELGGAINPFSTSTSATTPSTSSAAGINLESTNQRLDELNQKFERYAARVDAWATNLKVNNNVQDTREKLDTLSALESESSL